MVTIEFAVTIRVRACMQHVIETGQAISFPESHCSLHNYLCGEITFHLWITLTTQSDKKREIQTSAASKRGLLRTQTSLADCLSVIASHSSVVVNERLYVSTTMKLWLSTVCKWGNRYIPTCTMFFLRCKLIISLPPYSMYRIQSTKLTRCFLSFSTGFLFINPRTYISVHSYKSPLCWNQPWITFKH